MKYKSILFLNDKQIDDYITYLIDDAGKAPSLEHLYEWSNQLNEYIEDMGRQAMTIGTLAWVAIGVSFLLLMAGLPHPPTWVVIGGSMSAMWLGIQGDKNVKKINEVLIPALEQIELKLKEAS